MPANGASVWMDDYNEGLTGYLHLDYVDVPSWCRDVLLFDRQVLGMRMQFENADTKGPEAGKAFCWVVERCFVIPSSLLLFKNVRAGTALEGRFEAWLVNAEQ